MNNNNQGSYAQPEQQWVCPDCETVNTGDNCTVCGCPRPQEKPEEEQIVNEQGSYTENVQTWVCPECETRNTGNICTVCGHSRSNKKKLSKKVIAFAMSGAAVLIVGISIWLPYYRYQGICHLLESGQYEQAYQAFTEMGDYLDSTSKAEQALCDWAESLGSAGQYEQALEMLGQFPDGSQEKERLIAVCIEWAEKLNDSEEYTLALKILDSLPDSETASRLRMDVNYNIGRYLFRKEKDYKEAYVQFEELGDYRYSKEHMDWIVREWYEEILDNSSLREARVFANTVSLTRAQSDKLYQKLLETELYEYSSDGSWSYKMNALQVREILIDTLVVSLDYTYRSQLKTLFSSFNGDNPTVFVQKHRDILEDLWDFPVAQNIVVNDSCINEWLLGNWITDSRSASFKFTESDSGGYTTTVSLPKVSKPAGTKYYAIRNMTYMWTDKDDILLAKVFRIKLLEPDKIEVYAFKNQKTYTLIRE